MIMILEIADLKNIERKERPNIPYFHYPDLEVNKSKDYLHSMQ